MLGRILVFIVVCVVFGYGLYWLLHNGPQNLFKNSTFFQNPFVFENDPELGLLPVYPIPEYRGLELPYTTDTVIAGDDRLSYLFIEDGLLETEAEYDRLRSIVQDARMFGDPSPYRDTVRITYTSPTFEPVAASEEYIQLETVFGASESVSLSGWSIQSMVTGIRVPIPHATRTLYTDTNNTLHPVIVDPGMRVIISSGASPVGVSFRENSCSGYLEQFQSFTPSLDTFSCPRAADELPVTAENIQMYGESCISFVSGIPACTLYTQSFPADISLACRNYVQRALTYMGCVRAHEWRPSFTGDTWRVFLNQPQALWQPTHDVIRLLDAEGKTVDVLSY